MQHGFEEVKKLMTDTMPVHFGKVVWCQVQLVKSQGLVAVAKEQTFAADVGAVAQRVVIFQRGALYACGVEQGMEHYAPWTERLGGVFAQ